MEFKTFAAVVKKQVREVVGKDMRVELHTTTKNNGKELVGLIIKNDQTNITPVIYLEEYYDLWKNGMRMPEIIAHIKGLYNAVAQTELWELNVYEAYSEMKSKLACKLINYKKNKKFLEEVPYVPYLDFAIIFYALIDINERGTTTMVIREPYLASWNISVEQLYEDAIQNSMDMLPAKLQPISEVISEILDEEDMVDYASGEERMYVLSNEKRNLGASCILYPGELKRISDMLGESFYMLPSSIHEVLVIPESKALLKSDLDSMVQEINETQVEVEEVLSDHVYFYHQKKNVLSY